MDVNLSKLREIVKESRAWQAIVHRVTRSQDRQKNPHLRCRCNCPGLLLAALLPCKLTAYERLVLFLERIKPESMVVRIQYPTMKAGDLHLMYIQQVREEFEHNVSQQIYVSEDLWRFVIAAKESLLQFINTCSESVPKDVPAVELSKILIEKYNETENPPIDIALVVLKNEIKTLA